MELTEILKISVITGIELHAVCVVLIVMMYVKMRRSYLCNERKNALALSCVYLGSALMIVSDCLWTSVSSLGTPGDSTAFFINVVYFVSSATSASCWFLFCMDYLQVSFLKNKTVQSLFFLPYGLAIFLYAISPLTGLVFTIREGVYVRGVLFFTDPLIKMGYIVAAAVFAVLYGREKEVGYLRKKDYNLALFGIPVLVCGLLQTITGSDFNCLGVTLGLLYIYLTGITNPDIDNTEAIYSLGNSFEASYIINMDTGRIRPIGQDVMHDKNMPGMKENDYTEHFIGVLSEILLPEDKQSTLEKFSLENVEKRFDIDSAFAIRYRVKEPSGLTVIHSAAFIRATGNEGKREFLLGINTIGSESLLYERNENLNGENRLEQINTNIIESVAKIVEARDSGTGDHVVRVKKLTEVLARELMKEYPEYDLDEEMVKMISAASVLHDVGKIVIPDCVLLKPGKLDEEEFRMMKSHSTKGCDVLNLFPLGLDDAFLECALSICRWHHEKYDGSGYPDGLKGDEIPIAAQLVSVADCFDALISDRPYKKAYSPEKAFEMIINGECGVFSPKVLHCMEKQKDKMAELAGQYI